MTTRLSPQAIEHLTFLITGGDDPIEVLPPAYRTGAQITSWMQQFLPSFDLNSRSRSASVRESLHELNDDPDQEPLLHSIVAAAIDPRDFAFHQELLQRQINAFNAILHYDGYQLVPAARGLRLEAIAELVPQVQLFSDTLVDLNWDSVEAELQRMLDACETDPADAITAACSLVEAMCRSLIIELGIPMPTDRSVSTLYSTLIRELGLAPDRSDFPEEVAEESRRILGSLKTTVEGLGPLRTKGGDAHGREPARKYVDSRIARLAVGSASTIAQFLVESWHRKSGQSRESSSTCP